MLVFIKDNRFIIQLSRVVFISKVPCPLIKTGLEMEAVF